MATTRIMRAEVRHEDGHRVLVLPDDITLEGDEVLVSQDAKTGEVRVASREGARRRREEMFAYIDALSIPQEDLDAFMAERPMNVEVGLRRLFENEE